MAPPPGAPGSFAPAGPPPARFGSTTVSPGRGDAIGGLIASNAEVPPPAAVQREALPPAISGGDGATPKQLYETAYGYLLQQDYGAAEAAFTEFLQRHPNDQLASNAQYWLGESYFVRGQYKDAASSFLKGVQKYGQGAKAPDSLLKLAMSLDRLGQRDAACASFAEVGSRFPNAPSRVRSRATAELQRIRCG
jgi:tol-pal system protein YbgF